MKYQNRKWKRGLLALAVAAICFQPQLHAQEEFSSLVSGSGNPQAYDLGKCLQVALEHNAEIKAARERLLKSDGLVVEVRSGLLPKLGADGYLLKVDQARLQSFNSQTFGSDSDWAAKAEVQQPVFAGGRYYQSFRRSRFAREAARHEVEAVLDQLVFEVISRFYAVLLARAQILVQEKLITLQEEELESEKKKRDVGTVSDYNVLRAEVALANSRAPLIRARNDEKLALEDLRRVLGLPHQNRDEHERFSVAGELKYAPQVLELESSLETARTRRPELMRLKTLIEAEKAGVRVAQADYFPSLAAYANYGYEKSRFSDRFRDEVHGWEVGLRGSWNIFDSLGREGRVTQARADLQSAQTAYAQALLDVDVAVRRAYSSVIEANELVKASEKVIEQGLESLRLAQARFEVGAGTQLEVLDSQAALTNARSNRVQALHDYNLALAAFERSIGIISADKYTVDVSESTGDSGVKDAAQR